MLTFLRHNCYKFKVGINLMLRLEKTKKLLKKKGVEIEILMLNDPDYLSKLNDIELKYKKHAAYEQLRFMLNRMRDNPVEGLNGVATGRVNDLISLRPRNRRIAIICLNENKRNDKFRQALFLDECLGHIVLDIYPKLKKKLSFSNNPVTNKIAYDLFAKIFGVYHYATENGPAIVKPLIADYSKKVFKQTLGYRPEENILPAFSEKLVEVLQSLDLKIMDHPKKIERLVETIEEALIDLDSKTIARWKHFCQCAQDMAWRGFSPREVLTAAVSGSESPYFHSISRQLAKNIGVKIDEAPLKDLDFNAFGSDIDNEKRHERKIRQTLSDILDETSKGLKSEAFHAHANKQNEDLIEGRFVGWCARALQSAGTLFDKLITDGDKEFHEVQKEVKDSFFKTVKDDDFAWSTLKSFSDKIIDEVRDGNIVTYSKVAQIANDNGLEAVADSVNLTLSSPEVQTKLENAQPSAPKAAQPKSEAPKAAPKLAARPAISLSVPTMGLGGSGSKPSASGRKVNVRKSEQSKENRVLDSDSEIKILL